MLLNGCTFAVANRKKAPVAMSLKSILLIVCTAVVVVLLTRMIWRAWHYRKSHPDEVLWPYYGPFYKDETNNNSHEDKAQ